MKPMLRWTGVCCGHKLYLNFGEKIHKILSCFYEGFLLAFTFLSLMTRSEMSLIGVKLRPSGMQISLLKASHKTLILWWFFLSKVNFIKHWSCEIKESTHFWEQQSYHLSKYSRGNYHWKKSQDRWTKPIFSFWKKKGEHLGFVFGKGMSAKICLGNYVKWHILFKYQWQRQYFRIYLGAPWYICVDTCQDMLHLQGRQHKLLLNILVRSDKAICLVI